MFLRAMLFALMWSLPLATRAQAPADADAHTRVGDRMPAVSVREVPSGTFALEQERGKVVVVNFWATWCGPCMVEMPSLEKQVWERHKGDPGFAMVAIAREQTEATVARFQKAHAEYTFPLAVDPDRSTYKLFADAGIPRSYVVNRHGVIVYQSVGYDPDGAGEIDRAVKKALAER